MTDRPPDGTPPEQPGEDRDDPFLAQLGALRRSLAQSVVVTGERVQETMEDAVRRGRMTRKDAQELVAAIAAASRRQTDEIRQEIEALLERGRRLGRKVPESEDVDPPAVSIPIERADDAERPPSGAEGLPIQGYGELTAVVIRGRLKDLSDDELRTVRAHEAAHAARKTVLQAIDRRLRA